MRSFLTFLSLFTLFFFLAPVLCLSAPLPEEEVPLPKLPSQITRKGEICSGEDLILGTLAAMDVRGYQEEALKAAAVIATTKLVKTVIETGNADTLTVLSSEEAKASWGDYWFSQYWPQLQKAVSDTWGEFLTQDGQIYPAPSVFPVSWGKTEEGAECPRDETSNDFQTTVTVPLEEFLQVFPQYSASLSIKNAPSGRVETVTSGEKILTGYEMMELFHLPSPAFTVTVKTSSVTFRCKGKGNGRGMSLYGANELAKQGADYREILAVFYPRGEVQEGNRSLGSK